LVKKLHQAPPGQVEKQMPKEDQEVSKEAMGTMGTMGTMGGWEWRQGCV